MPGLAESTWSSFSAFDLEEQPSASAEHSLVYRVARRAVDQTPTAYGNAGNVTVTDASAVARKLSQSVPQSTVDAVNSEHQRLVDKHFEDGLSRSETAQLEYLRWKIDRLELSEMADDLAALRTLVEAHERISADVEAFAKEARRVSRPPRGRK